MLSAWWALVLTAVAVAQEPSADPPVLDSPPSAGASVEVIEPAVNSQEPAPPATAEPASARAMSPEEAAKMERLGMFLDQEAAAPERPSREAAQTVAQPPPRERSSVEIYLRALGGLFVALALILLVYAVLKRTRASKAVGTGGELAERLGRVYLDRGVCLHFIRTAGKVLVIGVAPNSISLVAELDEGLFESKPQQEAAEPAGTESFLAQLEEKTRAMTQGSAAMVPDTELDALREDIERLQQYLKQDVADASE